MTLQEAAMAALKKESDQREKTEQNYRKERAADTARMAKDILGFNATPNHATGTATIDGLEFCLSRSNGITCLQVLRPCCECAANVPVDVYSLARLGAALADVPLCDECRHAQWYNPPSEPEASPVAVKLAQAIMDALAELREDE